MAVVVGCIGESADQNVRSSPESLVGGIRLRRFDHTA